LPPIDKLLLPGAAKSTADSSDSESSDPIIHNTPHHLLPGPRPGVSLLDSVGGWPTERRPPGAAEAATDQGGSAAYHLRVLLSIVLPYWLGSAARFSVTIFAAGMVGRLGTPVDPPATGVATVLGNTTRLRCPPQPPPPPRPSPLPCAVVSQLAPGRRVLKRGGGAGQHGLRGEHGAGHALLPGLRCGAVRAAGPAGAARLLHQLRHCLVRAHSPAAFPRVLCANPSPRSVPAWALWITAAPLLHAAGVAPELALAVQTYTRWRCALLAPRSHAPRWRTGRT
jgi:hypothetical protein